MAEKKTVERAKGAKRAGKSPSTQAGEFVREEIKHVREKKHGARSAKQAIAIGLSKARRAGVKVKPPAKGRVSAKTQKNAVATTKKAQSHAPISKTRSAASKKALKKESYTSVSHSALSKQTREAAKKRPSTVKSRVVKKAAVTKGPQKRSTAVKKAVAPKGLKRSTTAKRTAKIPTKKSK